MNWEDYVHARRAMNEERIGVPERIAQAAEEAKWDASIKNARQAG